MKPFSFTLLLLLLAACKSEGTSELHDQCIKIAQDSDQIAECHFLYSDWKTLNGDGLKKVTIPLKAIAASLAIDDHEVSTQTTLKSRTLKKFKAMMESFGLFYPESIENLKEASYQNLFQTIQGEIPLPLGATGGKINSGNHASVYGSVFTCASCHAGRLYDADGMPTQKAWLGIPNTSYNVSALMDRAYLQLNLIVDRWPEFIKTYKKVFAVDAMNAEVLGLALSKKLLSDSMHHYRRTTNSFRPYLSGEPGLTNGIAAMEYNLGIYQAPDLAHPGDMAMVGAPILVNRQFRSSLLVDGIYHDQNTVQNHAVSQTDLSDEASWEQKTKIIANIASIFTIGTVGTSPENAFQLRSSVNDTLQSILKNKAPPFPGLIHVARAKAGQSIYETKCASCHGTYSQGLENLKLISFPNRFIPLEKIGTDPIRVTRIRAEAIAKLKSLKVSQGIAVEPRAGYIAPLLSGLWITAPYLHNGSVPTLWDLMHPENRPLKFKIGGHALNYEKMGLDYPAGYVPFVKPVVYDTRLTGQSNRGHEFPFNHMNEDEKRALLEFLKLL